MANPKRGEIILNLAGKKYKAKITLDVIMRIETAVGMSIVKIMQQLAEGALRSTQMLSILTPALRSGGLDIDDKEAGKIMWEAGLSESIKAVGDICGVILASGDDEGNEEEAENRLV